ncbi:hypothetical protein GCM10009548_70830 [Streptomyces malaysiensis subsp. malaysiensis]
MPDDPFTTGITLTPRVDRYGLITMKMCRYSVPVRFIDRKVTVTLTCDELIVCDASADCAGYHSGHGLLKIDELGHLELDRRGAEMLFHVLNERGEKNSIAVASNEAFTGWSRTFIDPRPCAAIVDRRTFNATLIETGSESYRLARSKANRTKRSS